MWLVFVFVARFLQAAAGCAAHACLLSTHIREINIRPPREAISRIVLRLAVPDEANGGMLLLHRQSHDLAGESNQDEAHNDLDGMEAMSELHTGHAHVFSISNIHL